LFLIDYSFHSFILFDHSIHDTLFSLLHSIPTFTFLLHCYSFPFVTIRAFHCYSFDRYIRSHSFHYIVTFIITFVIFRLLIHRLTFILFIVDSFIVVWLKASFDDYSFWSRCYRSFTVIPLHFIDTTFIIVVGGDTICCSHHSWPCIHSFHCCHSFYRSRSHYDPHFSYLPHSFDTIPHILSFNWPPLSFIPVTVLGNSFTSLFSFIHIRCTWVRRISSYSLFVHSVIRYCYSIIHLFLTHCCCYICCSFIRWPHSSWHCDSLHSFIVTFISFIAIRPLITFTFSFYSFIHTFSSLLFLPIPTFAFIPLTFLFGISFYFTFILIDFTFSFIYFIHCLHSFIHRLTTFCWSFSRLSYIYLLLPGTISFIPAFLRSTIVTIVRWYISLLPRVSVGTYVLILFLFVLLIHSLNFHLRYDFLISFICSLLRCSLHSISFVSLRYDCDPLRFHVAISLFVSFSRLRYRACHSLLIYLFYVVPHFVTVDSIHPHSIHSLIIYIRWYIWCTFVVHL